MNKKTILACLALGGFVLCGCAKAEPKKTYTVIWKDENGNVLETDSAVEEGTTPTYDSAMPTKTPTVDKEYSFSGWSPAVAPVTADVVYTATFQEGVRKYTVTWKSDESTVIKTEQVAYNTTPVYSGATPTKASTAEHTYTYNGSWDPAPAALSSDATYVAQYDEDVHSYHVYFRNEDGSELMDAGVIAYSGIDSAPDSYTGATPEKASTAQYSYEWDHTWAKSVDVTNSEVVFTPNFTSDLRKYTIDWYDGNGNYIKSSYEVPYGTTPVYDGPTPTKNQTATVRYIFNDTWTPALALVNGDAEYQANFNEGKALYSVRFENSNGEHLQTFDGEDRVEYDDVHASELYTSVPACPGDTNLNWEFVGWEEQLPMDTSNFVRTFRATYNATSTKPEALSYTYVDGVNPYYIVNGFVSDHSTILLTVPSTYNDGVHGEYPVTEIREEAFNWGSLEKIVLPSSITSIGDTAFNANTNLKTVEVAGNPNIGESAFNNCINLETFTMSGNGAYTIGHNAFSYDAKLVNLTLGSGCTEIGYSAFVNCQFTSFPVLNDLESIDYRAFEGCSKLTDFTFGNKLTYIGYCAFSKCASINEVTISDSVTNMANSSKIVFEDCGVINTFRIGKGLTEFYHWISGNTIVNAYAVGEDHPTLKVVDGVVFEKDASDDPVKLVGFPNGKGGDYIVPDTVEELGASCFAGASLLNSITFSDGVTYIPSSAFTGCGATTITLPSTVLQIAGYAFQDCDVVNLSLGASVYDIDSTAFIGCDHLTNLSIDPSNTHYLAENLVIYNPDKTTLYLVVPCKNDETFETPSTVERVEDHAFHGSKIGHVTIGNNVTYLGQDAFNSAECDRITVGDGVTTIRMDTFKDALTPVIEISENVTQILQGAFKNTKITSFTMPTACTDLDSEVFYECDELSEFHFNEQSNITMDGYIFYHTALTEFEFPDSVKSIGSGMFGDCDDLVTLDLSKLGNTITTLPSYFATGCDNLEEIKLTDYMTVIEQRAISYCPKLTDLILPSGLTEIGYYGLAGNTSLVDITLPATLTTLGSCALQNVGATTINYAGTAEDWLDPTFKSNRSSSWFNWPWAAGQNFVQTSTSKLDLFDEANR